MTKLESLHTDHQQDIHHDQRYRYIMAEKIAERTMDAYSADRYRSWAAVAKLLLKRGYDEAETEAIMRSKWTRWAADRSECDYGAVPAKAVGEYLDAEERRIGVLGLKQDVKELVAGTF